MDLNDIRIDPEFEEKIPPLTEDRISWSVEHISSYNLDLYYDLGIQLDNIFNRYSMNEERYRLLKNLTIIAEKKYGHISIEYRKIISNLEMISRLLGLVEEADKYEIEVKRIEIQLYPDNGQRKARELYKWVIANRKTIRFSEARDTLYQSLNITEQLLEENDLGKQM